MGAATVMVVFGGGATKFVPFRKSPVWRGALLGLAWNAKPGRAPKPIWLPKISIYNFSRIPSLYALENVVNVIADNAVANNNSTHSPQLFNVSTVTHVPFTANTSPTT